MLRPTINIHSLQTSEIIDRIQKSGPPSDIHFINSYNIGLAMLDREYCLLLQNASLNFIDGKILMKCLRFWTGSESITQVRGVDFMRSCLQNDLTGSPLFARQYFLGGSEEVAQSLVRKAGEINPQIECEYFSPPFGPIESFDLSAITRDIEMFSPDIVWIGLGTPKQDYFAHLMANRINVPVVSIGAAFDFLAGSRQESSLRMQQKGLEWLTRLAEEPRRLWKRYLIVSPLALIYPVIISIAHNSSRNLD